MTPEGKIVVNEILAPYRGIVETPVADGQNVRFVKFTIKGPSEDPLNALDASGLMLHSEEDVAEQLKRREASKPLFRIISFSHHPSGTNTELLEDLNTLPADGPNLPPRRGNESAHDRAPVSRNPPILYASADMYPPGHPSRTGIPIK
jgi:hypothetical protein